MAEAGDSGAETGFARLFEGAAAHPEAVVFALPGGAELYEAGEAADAFFVVRTGRLGVLRASEGHAPVMLGVIGPGEPAGEMALVAGTPHTATVIALRDSEVWRLPRDAFFAEAARDPPLMAELARLMIRRARQPTPLREARPATVFSLLGVGEARARPLADAIASALLGMNTRAIVVGAEALERPTGWFTDMEAAHDLVLYAADAGQGGWIELCGRQADRLLMVGRGDRPPPGPAVQAQTVRQRALDLVLLRPPGSEAVSGSRAWREATGAARLFNVREGERADMARLARELTGRSVGLVLSGGGARAYAHVGAVQALRDARAPIDVVGGASMGAVIGAGVAMGWNDAEIDARIRDAFVRSSPVGDMALPLIAMTQGRVVQERLEAHFGGIEIEDLRLPFFCVASNLTTGELKVYRSGPVVRALRASISLPGVLPPVVEGQEVLVDGAVMRNLPTDVLRLVHDGPVVGVDVSRSHVLMADEVARPESVWKWIRSGDWLKGPPLVSLLMRAATVSSARDLAASRAAADLLITPDVEGVEIRDWKAFEPAVASGYTAATAALAALETPVTELRRAHRRPA